jgi:hypothetical protein
MASRLIGWLQRQVGWLDTCAGTLARLKRGTLVMKLKVVAASILLLAACVASAEDAPITGKWSGSYTGGRGTPITTRVVLDIQSVEGETVKGRGSVNSTMGRGQGCSGEFPLEGTFKDNTLRVKAADKFGPGGDCTFGLSGAVEGNKLNAKRGANEFVMTK